MTTADECHAVTPISDHGPEAVCCLPPGHDGMHWDQLEGWEW